MALILAIVNLIALCIFCYLQYNINDKQFTFNKSTLYKFDLILKKEAERQGRG